MAMTLNDATAAIEANGFRLNKTTSKVAEYQSEKSRRILYLRVNQGFPDRADLAIHPEVDPAPILAIPGVHANPRVEFRFSSNMSAFPKKPNEGQAPEHYGRALRADSQTALSELCKQYA